MSSLAPCEEKMKEVNYYFVQGGKENSFSQIYLGHANRVVSGFIARGKPEKISRAKIEMNILEGFDKQFFPTAFRLACFSMVAHTDIFDVYWLSKRDEYGLSRAAVTRMRPNYDLIFDVPQLDPSDSPTESLGSFGSGSIPLPNASGYESDDNPLAESEAYGLKDSASDESAPSSTLVSPVIDEFTPAPTPAPDLEQTANTATGRPKRAATKQPAKAKAKAAPKKKGPGASKTPKTSKVTNGGSETYEPSAMNGDDDEGYLVPKPGQTGGKMIPSPKTGSKRPRATAGAKGKGGGKKSVRFDLSEK